MTVINIEQTTHEYASTTVTEGILASTSPTDTFEQSSTPFTTITAKPKKTTPPVYYTTAEAGSEVHNSSAGTEPLTTFSIADTKC